MDINAQGRIIDYKAPLDYEMMNTYLDVLAERYSIVSVISIGQTVLGKRIPLISIGRGKKSVLYVGCCSGTDIGTASVLLRYINEYCDHIVSDSRIYNCSAAYLFATRTIVVVPMLNPDGAEYYVNGAEQNNPFYERMIKGADLSKWRGNARGVELRENFGESFDNASSIYCEPETGALRNYLMFNRDIKLVLSLNKSKHGVVSTHEGSTPPRLNSLGRALAGMCITEYERQNVKNSLCSFCAGELIIPCFELNSTYVDQTDVFTDYCRQRKAIFLAPTLI